jgi:tRNA-dihydrouridine synthase A
MVGLYHGLPRARLWRRMLSDAQMLKQNNPELLRQALHAAEKIGTDPICREMGPVPI